MSENVPAKRKAIVTGAATGLGASIAAKLASEGASVLMVDINPEVEVLAKKISEHCTGMICDLSDPNCGKHIFESAARILGGCDILINNAAWSYHCAFEEVSVTDFDKLVAINQRAPFLLTQAFACALDKMSLKPHDPCVVHISSVNAINGNIYLIAYSSTKGAIESMTRSMAVELAPRGIRVNAVRPATIDTDQFHAALRGKELDPISFWNNFLVKRPTAPSDIADAVVFLCGPSARTITGTIWTIDGGYSAQ